jgi:multidrug efflux pump subunit AcrB
MTRFWTFFITKHNFTILLGIVLTVSGLAAVAIIPKESSPEIQIPIGIVSTALPGASAEDVEALITNVIEDAVLGIENVNTVTSSSGDGISSITVEFAARADIDRSIQLLKDKVDEVKAELPEDATDPVVSDVNLADQPILIISIAGALAPAELTALGEELSDEIERIRGVSSVSISGVQDREVTVVASQAKLAQYGLSLSDVTNAINAAGVASPAGSITSDGVRYAVRMEAAIQGAEDVGSVVIDGPQGQVVYVRDVAEVFDGLSEPASISRVSVGGNPSDPALTLSVFKSRGGNILETGSAVKDRIEELRGSLLSGTETAITYDAAQFIEDDLIKLSRVGIETVLLVVGVLLLTIGWRESLVAALSIPLSFLIAFIGLAASGNTINFISLFSLILAIGILVDSGIVVVEAIHTKLIRHGDKRRAAIETLKEYAWPLTAGTLTTVAVFAPLFFLSGIVGKYVASIPFTVIFVLIASIFVALGLVPLIAMYLVRKEPSAIEVRQEALNERAKEWYATWLRSMLTNRTRGNRFMALMVGLFLFSLTLPVTGLVQTIFFPPEDMEFIYVEIEKPVGTALSETDLAVREVEEYLYQNPYITSFVADVGAGSAFSGSSQVGTHIGSITINLTDDREMMSSEIAAALRETLAPISSAEITVSEPTNGPPTGAAISVTFTGNDLVALSAATERGSRVLAGIEGVTNIDTSTRDDGTEFVIRLDAEKAAELGVSTRVAADTIRAALFGADAADFRDGSSDVEIRTKIDLNPEYTDPSETDDVTIEAVRALLISGTQGPVPLASFADIAYEPASAVIRHEDGVRIATLTADVGAGGNALEITSEFLSRMEGEELPQGVTMSTGGESEDVNQSFIEMILALLAGAALMLAILVLEFNSFRHSFYLLLIIPLSLVGVLFGLLLTGSPLSFPSMLGVIALSGVIINHAIILMDSIARLSETHSAEKNLTDIIVEASATRLRPIVLTTITTCVGMIPLALSAGMWGPLAFAIMFGLAWALLLTLGLLPILYHRAPGKDIESKYNHV